MEKRRPTYDLDKIKRAFTDPNNIDVTNSAMRSAQRIGFEIQDIIQVIQALEKKDFLKSMTSHYNHKIWQDVYNIVWRNMILYIKFTEVEITGFSLLSFKEV